MRSPGSAFDLRAALAEEVQGALEELKKSGPKALHRCRVRLRRARAIARVGRAVAPGLAAVFNNSARAIMRTLAEAHTLAALADTARRLAKRLKNRAAAGLKQAADALDTDRTTLPPLDLAAVNSGLRDLLALAQVWPEASNRQVERGARRVLRRARRAWRNGRKKTAPAEKHHAWRQREKDRLYVAEVLDDAWPAKQPRRRRQNRRLVEALGRERDLALLSQRLGTTPPASGEPANAAALRAIRQQRRQLTARARRLAARVHAA